MWRLSGPCFVSNVWYPSKLKSGQKVTSLCMLSSSNLSVEWKRAPSRHRPATPAATPQVCQRQAKAITTLEQNGSRQPERVRRKLELKSRREQGWGNKGIEGWRRKEGRDKKNKERTRETGRENNRAGPLSHKISKHFLFHSVSQRGCEVIW